MIKRFILFIGILFVFQSVAFGQDDSAFGKLIGKEDEFKHRKIKRVDNFDIGRYNEFLKLYNTTLDTYNSSYGEEKDSAGELLLALSKDTIFIKLGVLKKRIADFNLYFDKYNFTESEKSSYNEIKDSYDEYISKMSPSVNGAKNLEEIKKIGKGINRDLYFDTDINPGLIQQLDFFKVKVSLKEGPKTIEEIRKHFPLIQKHLAAAAEAGVLVEDYQKTYEEVVDDLKRIDAAYDDISEDIKSGVKSQTKVEEIYNLNKDLKSDVKSMLNIVSYLKERFGISPWKLN